MTPSFGLRHWFRRPSLWICVIGILLSAVPIFELPDTSYYESIAAQSTLVFFVIAPAVSAAMAWEASRFRPVTELGRKTVVRIYVNRIFLWSLLFPVGYSLATLSQSIDSVALGSSLFWLMLAYSFIVGSCWTLIGSALGFTFKPLLSVCLVAALAYTWYAVLPSTPPGPLRRITGDFLTCCSLDATLDVKAVGIAIGGIVGFALATVSAAALLRHQNQMYMFTLALGASLIAISLFFTQRVTDFGLEQREPRQMTCSSNVCAWPEIPQESIALNIEARDAFSKIAPPQWRDFSDRPVIWGEFSGEHLALSAQPTVEGIVGEFIDQAGFAELVRTNATVCGISAKELGVTLSGLPWDPRHNVNIGDVIRRIEDVTCRASG